MKNLHEFSAAARKITATVFMPIRLLYHKAKEVINEARTTPGAIFGSIARVVGNGAVMAAAAYGANAALSCVTPSIMSAYLPKIAALSALYLVTLKLGNGVADFEPIPSRESVRTLRVAQQDHRCTQ